MLISLRKIIARRFNWFLNYVDLENNPGATTYVDAFNRIGDCYFNARNFAKPRLIIRGLRHWVRTQAIMQLFKALMWLVFRKTTVLKLIALKVLFRNIQNQNTLMMLVWNWPGVRYVKESDAKAISTFQRLLSVQPNSKLAPKSSPRNRYDLF